MHRETKATRIPKEVTIKVWERDRGRCLLCDNNRGIANAHFVRRSHGGKGIEQNIFTACHECHTNYDQYRFEDMEQKTEHLRNHFKRHYPDWNEKKLVYKKWND
jgi:5-methylcytosine-specific restriction endonuclease McrA